MGRGAWLIVIALGTSCGRVRFAPAEDATSARTCTPAPGPMAVWVGGFCIDSTEVTNAQYAEFLVAKAGDTSGQPALCANNDHVPINAWPAPAGEDTVPVVFVDWCDARAYCEWAGKRLCGRIGGGPTPYSAWADPAVDEWTFACTGGGAHAYPYGDTFEPSTCDVMESGIGRTTPVGSLPGCVGGFPGLHDLSGNVLEWESSCSATDCSARGGSFGDNLATGRLGCTSGRSSVIVGNAYSLNGFRCCADS